ncbi:hypothetical protein JOD20_005076 [Herpetosiphon giganteus]|nr:hypothetical protein [Herpetosiphon giganteus]
MAVLSMMVGSPIVLPLARVQMMVGSPIVLPSPGFSGFIHDGRFSNRAPPRPRSVGE